MQRLGSDIPVRIKRLGPAHARAALVFVHGAGLHCEAWGSLPRLCAGDGLRTFAVDLPGHGGSGGPAPASIGAMAGWLAEAVGGWHRARPVLVGHSMGALVALDAAARNPGLAVGLILIGAGARMPVNPRLLATAREAPAQAAALIARWAFRDGRPAGTNPSPTPTMRMAARRLLGAAAPGVLAADLAACDAYAEATAQAARIACPALVIIGADDRMAPPAAGMALAEALPDARVVTIPACGHMPMVEAPRRTHAAIRSFVRELSP